ncbi:AT hook motif domain protein [Myxococcota bacterium]|jgi:transcriptional regulator with XRE-family HTH domain|nr:AT hook motif domain protein [Myxococcota bacterium]
MAKNKPAKIGRPTKGEGPKLSNPDEVERLLVEGEVVPDEHGEAKRVWLTQRDVAARFGVAVSTIAAFAKEHRTTERREELRAELDPPKTPLPPKVERSVEAPEPSDVVRASVEDSAEPAPENTAPSDERRRPGRPRHQQAPVIPFAELDRLLVFGEVSMNDDGTSNTVYPTYRELAEKYGVAPSVIADYAKSHNTMHRRKYGEHRIEARRDEKIIEARATAEAITVAEMLALIDEFLIKFREALKEGRVRTDSPADVNTLIRLKSFLEGGADSRQEIRHMLSLEVLSERHERYMRDLENSTPAMAGVIDAPGEVVSENEHGKSNSPDGVRLPPGRSPRDAEAEPNLSQDLCEEVRRLVNLARELADQMGADPDDDELIENRVLVAAAAVEARLGAHDGADVGPRGANAEEDER